jgi:hypothetical protein
MDIAKWLICGLVYGPGCVLLSILVFATLAWLLGVSDNPFHHFRSH